MKHQIKKNPLGRTTSHRKAMMANMAASLIEHKRISTTVAKAKALRGYVEPIITKSKEDTTHSRRLVFSQLQNKFAVSELFREVAPKVADRPGGYTRIIKTGFRQGDAAEMCIIELVDFNDVYTSDKKSASKKTRRSRRGTGASTDKKETKSVVAEVAETVVDKVEEIVEDVKDAAEDITSTEDNAGTDEKKEESK
jgi:large subunit ribosomal protein L17